MDPFDSATDWQRLDARMLLVHPVRDVVRFLPALVGILLFGRSADGGWWGLVGVGIPIALGLLRYLTTSYRIRSGRIEVRHGLVNKRVLSAPLDRVRTVDVTASPIHRVLGLVTLRIGTGQSDAKGDDRLALDGLAAPAAAALREHLLHLRPAPTSEREPPPVREVLRGADGVHRFALGEALQQVARFVRGDAPHARRVAVQRGAQRGGHLLQLGGIAVVEERGSSFEQGDGVLGAHPTIRPPVPPPGKRHRRGVRWTKARISPYGSFRPGRATAPHSTGC